MTQRFRQEGHAREAPLEFIQKQILYTRTMVPTHAVGMERAPSAWKTILVVESVPSVIELETRLNDLKSYLSKPLGVNK